MSRPGRSAHLRVIETPRRSYDDRGEPAGGHHLLMMRMLFAPLGTPSVNTHIRNLYAKLGADDRSAAVQRARQLRLLSNRLSPTSPK